MIPRKSFLGRTGAALVLLFVAGPRKLYGVFRTPTLTEALADGEWHRAEYTYGRGGFKSVLVDGREVRWHVEEQPPNGIARERCPIDNYVFLPGPVYVDPVSQWRMETTHDGRTSLRCRFDGGCWVKSLTHKAPTGKVLEV